MLPLIMLSKPCCIAPPGSPSHLFSFSRKSLPPAQFLWEVHPNQVYSDNKQQVTLEHGAKDVCVQASCLPFVVSEHSFNRNGSLGLFYGSKLLLGQTVGFQIIINLHKKNIIYCQHIYTLFIPSCTFLSL